MLDFVLMLTDFVMQVLRLTKQDVIAFVDRKGGEKGPRSE